MNADLPLLERIALATEHTAQANERIAQALEALLHSGDLATTAASASRLADHFSPAPSDILGTPAIARRLGCTTVWVAQLVRKGVIPRNCVVPGSGNGKPWKFFKDKIDAWLASR
jgi:hypothetical protein